ncbi:MAG: hypothetical protein EPN17_06190 [Methylobacter sp.]|nr:MAG: hypothetical protein EPN17_06190 [Methylobacter sp.]
MAAITFDTLKYANRLKAAGVPDKQAEDEAAVLAEAAALEVNLKDLKEELLAHQRAMHRDIDALRHEMDTRFAQVDARFVQLEQRLIIKLGALMIFSVGIVAVLVNFVG